MATYFFMQFCIVFVTFYLSSLKATGFYAAIEKDVRSSLVFGAKNCFHNCVQLNDACTL